MASMRKSAVRLHSHNVAALGEDLLEYQTYVYALCDANQLRLAA
jgi:hypothetical protein